VRVMLTLCDLWRLDGQLDKASQWLEKASQRDRLETGATKQLETGATEELEIGAIGNSSNVVMMRIRLLATQGRYEEIASVLSSYLTTRPLGLDVLLPGAQLLVSANDDRFLPQARAIFEHVTQVAPNQIPGYLGLAQVAYLMGDLKASGDAYRKVVALNPTNSSVTVQAVNGLAWVMYQQDTDLKQALKLAQRAVLLAGDNIHVLDTHARILEKMGELDQAKLDYEKCATLAKQQQDPTSQATALLCVGRVMMKTGQADKGKDKLLQARAIHEKHQCLKPDQVAELNGLLKNSE